VLGERVRDRSGKFRIHITELDWERFHEFLPIGFGYQPLCALVRFTLRDPLDYDIRLVLRPEEIRELRIGEKNDCRLGWTSWLGAKKQTAWSPWAAKFIKDVSHDQRRPATTHPGAGRRNPS
jgi:type VI secretion system protein ImpH